MPSATQSYTLWGISLGLAVVVLLVVAVLLTVILNIARRIDDGAKRIWVVGKNVANSTVQLSHLQQTNQVVADVIEAATGILHNAGRIAAHAQTCTGCPACVLGPTSSPRHGVDLFPDPSGSGGSPT